MSRFAEIVDADPGWPAAFARIAAELRQSLGTRALRIDHIGSTAVPGLAAKDRIDVQVSVAELARLDGYERFEDHVPPGELADGWTKLFASTGRANVHVRRAGARNERYALLFRDYLRAHPPMRDAYGEFKRRLAGSRPLPTGEYAELKDPVCDLVYAAAEDWARATGWRPGAPDA